MTELSFIETAYGIRAGWEPFGHGHIHATFRSADAKYILQRINTYVFRDPEALMENIDRFTAHLRQKLKTAGQDAARGTLTVVKTQRRQLFAAAPDQSVWRIYESIPDTFSYEYGEQTEQSLFECGRIFGEFQKMAADFPIEALHETIPHFHDTKSGTEDLKRAVSANIRGRAEICADEISFALKEANSIAGTILGPMEKGLVPVTVTHNDAKQNNVLFDRKTKKAVAVIDLDTLMPGSRLYDFGEALRLGCGNVDEDSADRSGMRLDLQLAEAFAAGYLPVMKDELTEAEKALLPDACRLMCYENGIRFLEDFLRGDVYFGAARTYQNLDRTRTQFEMYRLFTAHRDELDGIFRRYL